MNANPVDAAEAIAEEDAREAARAAAIDAAAPHWPEPMDLAALSKIVPTVPKNIMAGLPCGYATGIYGHGGAGKSSIALQLAICIAAGRPFYDLITQRSKVLYASCEDRADVLHWRISRICKHFNIEMASLAGKLQVLDLVGHESILFSPDPRTGHPLTGPYGTLDGRIKEYGSQVVFLDGITDVYNASENDRGAIKRFVNYLLALIPTDGAVVLIGHVNKAVAASNGATSEGYSGSTAWNNSVRARWYLRPGPGDEEGADAVPRAMLLELQKSNLSDKTAKITFMWDETAGMFTGQPTVVIGREERDWQEIQGILKALAACEKADPKIVVPAAMQGSRTAHNVLAVQPDFPKSLLDGTGKKRFKNHLEQLRRIRHIEDREYRRSNGHFATKIALTSEGHVAYVGFVDRI